MNFLDLMDSKSFNISLLSGIFLALIIEAVSLGKYFTNEIIANFQGIQLFVSDWIYMFKVIPLILIFILLAIEIKHYKKLNSIQEEINSARLKSKK